MEVKEGDYILGIWVLGNGERDWMASVVKHNGSGVWTLEYCFRYYDDEAVWNSGDVKNWYKGEIAGEETEEKVISAVETVMQGLKMSGFGDKEKKHIIRGGPEEMFEAFQDSEFFHMKQMSVEDEG